MPSEEQQTLAAETTGDSAKAGGPRAVPGVDPNDAAAAAKLGKSKTALKNEKRKAARAAEANKEVDKVAELAAAMGMAGPGVPTPTPPPPRPSKAAVPPAAPPSAAKPPAAAPAADGVAKEATEVEKKVRNLKKKLRGVDELVAKQASGVELNAEQLSKVATRGEIEAEISRWESLGDVEELGKEVKKLGKKLRQIEELEERQKAGESLNADQLGKIESKPKVIAEHAKMSDLLKQVPA